MFYNRGHLSALEEAEKNASLPLNVIVSAYRAFEESMGLKAQRET